MPAATGSFEQEGSAALPIGSAAAVEAAGGDRRGMRGSAPDDERPEPGQLGLVVVADGTALGHRDAEALPELIQIHRRALLDVLFGERRDDGLAKQRIAAVEEFHGRP